MRISTVKITRRALRNIPSSIESQEPIHDSRVEYIVRCVQNRWLSFLFDCKRSRERCRGGPGRMAPWREMAGRRLAELCCSNEWEQGCCAGGRVTYCQLSGDWLRTSGLVIILWLSIRSFLALGTDSPPRDDVKVKWRKRGFRAHICATNRGLGRS
ncbi:hypothetical protein B0H12DRAFT_517352 [Mycena haematopus]|nr:hypothetical protein B0H12DRAFT_517352 [Mycena haematopus]